ncbi:MAG: hypothetical protein IT285_05630 [Bdellovibrionales bacterium]|nr:hypothetical protein [Bdellovibrionales bacterium]
MRPGLRRARHWLGGTTPLLASLALLLSAAPGCTKIQDFLKPVEVPPEEAGPPQWRLGATDDPAEFDLRLMGSALAPSSTTQAYLDFKLTGTATGAGLVASFPFEPGDSSPEVHRVFARGYGPRSAGGKGWVKTSPVFDTIDDFAAQGILGNETSGGNLAAAMSLGGDLIAAFGAYQSTGSTSTAHAAIRMADEGWDQQSILTAPTFGEEAAHVNLSRGLGRSSDLVWDQVPSAWYGYIAGQNAIRIELNVGAPGENLYEYWVNGVRVRLTSNGANLTMSDELDELELEHQTDGADAVAEFVNLGCSTLSPAVQSRCAFLLSPNPLGSPDEPLHVYPVSAVTVAPSGVVRARRYDFLNGWGALSEPMSIGAGAEQVQMVADGVKRHALWVSRSPVNRADLALGQDHSCVLDNLDVRCFGRSNQGQVGTGTTADVSTPAQVHGPVAFSAVYSSGLHTCAISDVSDDRRVYCWGENGSSQLGVVGPTDRTTPVLAAAITDVMELAVGLNHTCAMRDSNSNGLADEIWCWGSNNSGQIADAGVFPSTDVAPTLITDFGGADYLSITAGNNFTCAVTDDDAVYCWGDNGLEQLGSGAGADTNVPTLVASPFAVHTKVRAHGNVACALSNDERLACWGENDLGQSGVVGAADPAPPGIVDTSLTDATDLPDVQDFGVGDSHVCAIVDSTDRTLVCWGSDQYGQLGNLRAECGGVAPGLPCEVHAPVVVAGPIQGVEHIAAGEDHTCAITDSKDTYCWGHGQYGTLGNGVSDLDAFAGQPVAISGATVCKGRECLLSATLDDPTRIRVQAVGTTSLQNGMGSFHASTSGQGDVFVTWVQCDDTLAADCVSGNSGFRHYGALRNAIGQWSPPARADSAFDGVFDFFVTNTPRMGQPVVQPRTAYVGEGKFLSVFNVTIQDEGDDPDEVVDDLGARMLMARLYDRVTGFEAQTLGVYGDSHDVEQFEDAGERLMAANRMEIAVTGSGDVTLVVQQPSISLGVTPSSAATTFYWRVLRFNAFDFDAESGDYDASGPVFTHSDLVCTGSTFACRAIDPPQLQLFDDDEALILLPGLNSGGYKRLHSVEYF